VIITDGKEKFLNSIFNPKLINEEAEFCQSFQEGLIKIVEENGCIDFEKERIRQSLIILRVCIKDKPLLCQHR